MSEPWKVLSEGGTIPSPGAVAKQKFLPELLLKMGCDIIIIVSEIGFQQAGQTCLIIRKVKQKCFSLFQEGSQAKV